MSEYDLRLTGGDVVLPGLGRTSVDVRARRGRACATWTCVRSTVVDAFACNFRVTVPAEAVYDRTPIVHQADLFDMARKYADVRPVAEVVEAVRGGE